MKNSLKLYQVKEVTCLYSITCEKSWGRDQRLLAFVASERERGVNFQFGLGVDITHAQNPTEGGLYLRTIFKQLSPTVKIFRGDEA